MAIAPEQISPEPITDAKEFARLGRETFNLGRRYVPDVGPVDLDIDDSDGAIAALREWLTAAGNELFREELASALIDYMVTEDFRHILAVVRPWFRTMALKSDPVYERSAEWARSISDEAAVAAARDVEDVIAELGRSRE